ncbi:MAG: NHL repeat-containing protein, partial [Nitrososphaerales archaeon]
LLFLLAFTPPSWAFTNGEAATTVVGQANFTSGANNAGQGTSPVSYGVSHALGIAFDSSGDLWVADTSNSRVLEFVPGSSGCAANTLCNGMSASLVLGQKTFTTNAANEGGTTNSSGLSDPWTLAFAPNGNLWVDDSFNNRILEFTKPFSDGEAASVVVGQSTMAGNSYNDGSGVCMSGCTNGVGFANPQGIAFDSSGDLWVADRGNNRVVEFVPGSSGCGAGLFCNGMTASKVIGQTNLANGGVSARAANTFYEPVGVAFAPNGNLWVLDGDNNRIMMFPSPLSTDESATVVLSEPNFTSQTGNLCSPSTLNATAICASAGIAIDTSGDVWVSDPYNNRIQEWVPGTSGCPVNQFCNNMAATVVIGQPSMTTTGASGLSSSGVHDPYGLAFDSGGNLWVADSDNSRILQFQLSASSTTSSSSSTTSSSTTSSTTSTTSATLVCPSTFGGVLMPPGATFTDGSGNVWVAPSGSLGGGFWSSYFFAGPPSAIPPPMLQGWAGVYGTYSGQKGWIVTFFC